MGEASADKQTASIDIGEVVKEHEDELLRGVGTDNDIVVINSKSHVDDSDPFTYKPSLGRLDSLLEKVPSEHPPSLISDDMEGDDEYADDLYEFDDFQSPKIKALSSIASQSIPPGVSSSSQSLIVDPPVRETSDGSSGSSQQQLPSWDQFHIATAEMFLNPTRLYSISHALSSRNLPDAVKDHGFITPEDVRAFIATTEVS